MAETPPLKRQAMWRLMQAMEPYPDSFINALADCVHEREPKRATEARDDCYQLSDWLGPHGRGLAG